MIGRTITIDSRPRAVTGVMPASFQFLDNNAELILPHRVDRSALRLGNFSYNGVARLKPGMTIQQANADVGRMLPIWLAAWPVPPGLDKKLFENARLTPSLRPLKQDVVGTIAGMLRVLMGTIGVVLLIACANVANLVLVQQDSDQFCTARNTGKRRRVTGKSQRAEGGPESVTTGCERNTMTTFWRGHCFARCGRCHERNFVVIDCRTATG